MQAEDDELNNSPASSIERNGLSTSNDNCNLDLFYD